MSDNFDNWRRCPAEMFAPMTDQRIRCHRANGHKGRHRGDEKVTRTHDWYSEIEI